LPALGRGHRGIETEPFHVKDDGFGEDRRVRRAHTAGATLGLLRSASLKLLRGRCLLWTADPPSTGRAE